MIILALLRSVVVTRPWGRRLMHEAVEHCYKDQGEEPGPYLFGLGVCGQREYRVTQAV